MRLGHTVRIRRGKLYEMLLLLLVVVIWAFNEEKYLSYPIKILFILGMFLYAVKRGRKIQRYHLWCVAIICMAFIASLVAGLTSGALYNLINFIQVILIGLALSLYLDCEEKVNKVMEYMVLGGLVLLVRLLLVTPLSTWLSFERLGADIGYNANDVGNKAALSAMFALALFRVSKGRKQTCYMAAFAALSVIVLFSGSRKALLAVLMFVAFIYSFGLKNKRNLVFAAVGLLVLGLGLYIVVMNNDTLYATIGRRIESMLNVLFHGGSEAGSIDLRMTYMNKAWELIKSSPIWGIGLGAFAEKSGFGVYCHCDYLEVMCSFGMIGGLLYYIPWIQYTLRYILLKQKSAMDHSILAYLLALLVMFVTMVMYMTAYVQILMVLALAGLRLRGARTRISQGDEKNDDFHTNHQ